MRDTVRPVVAAVLAVVLPGLGHLLLRRWGRAILWHGTIVGGTVLLYVIYDVEPTDPLADPSGFAAAVPPEVSIPVAFLVGLSAVDAYLVGREDAAAAAPQATRRREHDAAGDASGTAADDTVGPANGSDAATGPIDPADPDAGPPEVQCPNCGRKTDADIDFCHWCTEPLPWAEEE